MVGPQLSFARFVSPPVAFDFTTPQAVAPLATEIVTSLRSMATPPDRQRTAWSPARSSFDASSLPASSPPMMAQTIQSTGISGFLGPPST